MGTLYLRDSQTAAGGHKNARRARKNYRLGCGTVCLNKEICPPRFLYNKKCPVTEKSENHCFTSSNQLHGTCVLLTLGMQIVLTSSLPTCSTKLSWLNYPFILIKGQTGCVPEATIEAQ